VRRRVFLGSLGALTAAGWYYWPEDGFTNPCLDAELPDALAGNELIAAAWQDIDPRQFWDCHVHLLGLGDSGGGAWVNPDMREWIHPLLYAQYRFFLNAACVDEALRVDNDYVARLLADQAGLAPASRLMLLAFDYAYDADGQRLDAGSHFHVPNNYARDVARRHPEHLEWTASIHPYRNDAVSALEQATRDGARAVKWLPPSMNIDPASPRCDAFYEALVRLDLPLLSHAGVERAVHVPDAQKLGNPLRLRRALDHGVRVIVAHCASLGDGEDLDAGSGASKIANFELFARLMEEHRYENLLYGDISAMTQINRLGPALTTVLDRDDWHHRLINGSDYPLPGVFPLFSMTAMVQLGLIDEKRAQTIRAIRPHNALLFDFVLKRTIRHAGKGFAAKVFQTRRIFDKQRGVQT
jgi:mannonate dehydratase